MSFTSTYNSLSVRGWSAQAGQNFGPISFKSNVYCAEMAMSNDATKLVVGYSGTTTTNPAVVYTINGSTLTLYQNLTVTFGTFGSALDINENGEYIIAGSFAWAPNVSRHEWGRVDIYYNSGSSYSLQKTILGTSNYQGTGTMVRINNNGDTIAYTDVSNVKIYTRTSSTWTLEQTLTGSIYFPIDLDGSGNKLIIGHSSSGNVQVYTRTSNTWTLQQTLTNSDASVGDNFGAGIRISNDGNTIIATAPYKTINGNANVGAGYIFRFNGSTWSEVNIIKPSFTYANTKFGLYSSEISITSTGNNMLVGSSFAANAYPDQPGQIDIYTEGISNTWNYSQYLINPITVGQPDHYGTVTTTDGNMKYLATSYGANNQSQNNIILYGN